MKRLALAFLLVLIFGGMGGVWARPLPFLEPSPITCSGNNNCTTRGTLTLGGTSERLSGASNYLDLNDITGDVSANGESVATYPDLMYFLSNSHMYYLVNSYAPTYLSTMFLKNSVADVTEPAGSNPWMFYNISTGDLEAKGNGYIIKQKSLTAPTCAAIGCEDVDKIVATHSFIDGDIVFITTTEYGNIVANTSYTVCNADGGTDDFELDTPAGTCVGAACSTCVNNMDLVADASVTGIFHKVKYLCTGSGGTCADDADFTFDDSTGNGFAFWGYFNFPATGTTKILLNKFTGAGTREYKLEVIPNTMDMLLSLRDDDAGVTCYARTSENVLSSGWHWVAVEYTAATLADTTSYNDMSFYVDGEVVSKLAGVACTNYLGMEDLGNPVYIGAQSGSNSLQFLGDIGNFHFQKITSAGSAAMWRNRYQIDKAFYGL